MRGISSGLALAECDSLCGKERGGEEGFHCLYLPCMQLLTTECVILGDKLNGLDNLVCQIEISVALVCWSALLLLSCYLRPAYSPKVVAKSFGRGR